MIQDKDFTLRLIKQLTQALEKLLLGRPEESLMQKELDFDNLMKDIFSLNFSELASKTEAEITAMVQERQPRDHAAYYELLGNLFYYHFEETKNPDFAAKAKTFYEQYLQTSGIYALPVINRISALKNLA